MSALPIVLLAFAAGATLLQWQPELPAIEPWCVAAGVALASAVALDALIRWRVDAAAHAWDGHYRARWWRFRARC